MNEEEKFKKIDKNFDYIYFSRAYLMLAYSGIEKRKKSPLAEDLVYEIAENHNYILAPILYNIKHAIELFLKVTSKILEPDKDFEKIHDLDCLFSKIEIKLARNKNIKEKDIKNLKELIIKYHQNKFLNKKIENNFYIEDRHNDVFRYPDNKAKVELSFEKIFFQFKEKDFEEIKNDIKQFYKLFYDIGAEVLGINKELEAIEENFKIQ